MRIDGLREKTMWPIGFMMRRIGELNPDRVSPEGIRRSLTRLGGAMESYQEAST